eukprot:364540-Chlamydomonas_euryale.AAC.7
MPHATPRIGSGPVPSPCIHGYVSRNVPSLHLNLHRLKRDRRMHEESGTQVESSHAHGLTPVLNGMGRSCKAACIFSG